MADPLLITPGQIVLPDDFDAVLRQHAAAGARPVKSVQKVPDTDPALKPLLAEDGLDLQQTPLYRYYLDDGTMVEAITLPNGQYRVVDYKPSAKFTQEHSAAATARQQAVVGRVEGTPIPGQKNPDGTQAYDNTKPIWVERDPNTNQQVGPAKPLDANQRAQWEREQNQARGLGPLTDEQVRQQQQTQSGESREATPNRPGWTTITRIRKQGGQETQVTTYLPPGGGAEVPSLPAEPPKPVQGPDGTYGYWDTTGPQPKWVSIQGGPQAPKTPIQINGQYGYWDQSSGRPVWISIEAPAEKAPPPEVGQFAPDINKPAMGLVEYAQKLYALRSAGKITEKQQADALAYAHEAASSEATRLDHIRASQAQQQANEINQRNADLQASVSRGTQANTATQNAFTTAASLAGAMTPKNYTPGLMQAILGLQDARQQQWHGLDRPPTVGTQGYPMLQGLNQMGLPPSTAASLPSAQSLATPGPTSELGQPGDPSLAAATEQAAAAGGITSPAAQGLLATNEANRQQYEAAHATPPPPSPPGPTPPLGQGQDLSTPQPPTPVNPLTREPVPGQPVPPAANPNAPVGMASPIPGMPPQQAGMKVTHPIVEQVLATTQDPLMRQAILLAAQQAGFA